MQDAAAIIQTPHYDMDDQLIDGPALLEILGNIEGDNTAYMNTVQYGIVTSTVSGWVLSADIAVCKDREEWLDAWNIPDEEVTVITSGKVYLESSNNNLESSNVMLPMGTVLRKVSEEDYDAAVNGRSMYQNYAVWLPVRNDDGSYGTTIALIPQNRDVSDGFLPLTVNNILKVAFEKLGDVYGRGSMLESADCSNYI